MTTLNQVSFNVVNPRNSKGLAQSLTASLLITLGLIAWFFPYLVVSSVAFVIYCVNTRKVTTEVTEPDVWDGEVEQIQFTYEKPITSVPLLQSAPTVDDLTVMSYKELTEIAHKYRVSVKRAKRDMIKSLTSVLG